MSCLSDKLRLMKILTLAIPASVEYLFQTAVGFVDTVFVAKLGLTEVAAVGITNTIMDAYIAIFMAVGVGASSLIAQSIGGNNHRKASEIARQATILAFLIGILFGVLTFFLANPLLRIMGAEPKVLADGTIYFHIVGINSVFISLMFVLGSILRGSGNTLMPMKISIWINIIHVGLDYFFIFGFGNMAGLGVQGAAWATVISRLLGMSALFIAVMKSNIKFSLFKGGILSNWIITKELVMLSLPTAIERLLMRTGQIFYIGLIISMGTFTYAAHIIAGNIETLVFMPAYGLAIAATTLVGQSIGAKRIDEAYNYGLLTAVVGILIMACVSILIFCLCPWFASWFTAEKNVIDLVVIALKIDAFSLPALTLTFVLSGALQGAGDTKTPMYSTVVGMWLIRVVGVYLLGIHWHMGIAGVYLSAAVDMILRAIFLSFKFKKHIVICRNRTE